MDAFISISHIVAASLSLILGFIITIGVKGSSRHKSLGNIYFWAMVVNNITALFIMKAFGKWFFPHYLGIAALISVTIGWLAGKFKQSKRWLQVHIIFMTISFYLLVGGAINELFLHTPALRPLIIDNDPILGMTHSAAMFLFIVMLIYFLRKYRNMKR